MIEYKIYQPGGHHYTISIPPTYSDNKSTPLVLALHYAGHGSPYYGEGMLLSLINPAFQELEPIIVAPDCPAGDWLQLQSEAYVLALLDHIQEVYQIDPPRIILAGYSMGGIGAWNFAKRYPERFAAVVIMAASPPDDALEVEWKVPLMVIHGKMDELFPVQKTLQVVLGMEEQGTDIVYQILDGVTHFETQYFVSALRNSIPWLQEKWRTVDE
jgi:predicted peptidase